MTMLRPDRASGPEHAEFWDGCAQGELRIQRCGACGELSWPVTQSCNHCGGERLEWQVMSGRGTVFSWCRFVQDYYQARLPLPWDTVLIALEEGPLLLSNPHGFAAGPNCIGMAVQLTWLDCEDSAGRFRLPVFELAASSTR